MLMPDVNILVNAHRLEMPAHARYAAWLEEAVNGPEMIALSESVLAGFVRVVTNARVFKNPSTLEEAFAFIEMMTRREALLVRPGDRHFTIFRQLCERTNAKGPLVADAAHAALAIETGCEWVTADTDFARFSPPLRWRHL